MVGLCVFWSQCHPQIANPSCLHIIQKMESQGFKQRCIRQIRLAGSKAYMPNKYYSPYDFLVELQTAARKKYDLKVVEVRYIISKSKFAKDIDEHFTIANLNREDQFNNVFSIDNPFLKRLLGDCALLVPPEDFDPNKFDEENNAAKRHLEERKNEEIENALRLLMEVHQLTDPKNFKLQTRSLTRFKKEVQPALREGQVQIYIKVVLNDPTLEVIQKEKNSKNPIIVSTTTKQQIRVFFHPVKNNPENADLVAKLCPISDWSLCAMVPGGPRIGVTYWNMGELGRKIEESNGSIKILHHLSIHRNKKGNLDYFELYSFLFNQIVLKAVIYIAQVKRVQVWKEGEETEYYLHLAYPPRYFMAILKPDVGCDDGFIRSWQRVENFTFLKNPTVMKDEFIRLFLFSNTILRMRLSTKDPDIKVNMAKELLISTLSHFKGTIRIDPLAEPYDFGRKMTTLQTNFKFVNFKDKFNYALGGNFSTDKLWKLKYLLLVLVRYNKLLPSEIEKVLNLIEQGKQNIDIYIYIFWQKVSLLNTVAPEVETYDFIAELEAEFAQIKQLSIADITKRVSSNTDQICYVFKASLTPSGYLYSPPTPEMKGRLMKQYSNQSEHFLRVTITDDNQGTLKNQKYITKIPLKKMMQEIAVLDRKYIPLGWSPSQLRSYSLWYMHEVNVNRALIREQVLSFLGSFDHIDNPAKRAARIGQAFSSSWTFQCRPGEIQQKTLDDDRSCKGYLYTDGIGKISPDLIQRISLRLKIKDLSVVQVRYKGAKGILVMDPSLDRKTVHMRTSMIKYECKHDAAVKYLDILDWNKYKAGFLNRQTIILLKSLGISDKVFQKRHAEHIARLSSMSFKDCSIFKYMNEDLNSDLSNLQPANVTILHLLRAGFRLENEPFFRGVLQTMKKNGYHQLKVKSNILIEKSARIIGIIDEWDILQEGQLYCAVSDNISLTPKKQHVEGAVVITRNPCLHPADIRKMKCVGMAEVQARFNALGKDNIFSSYVNCVIFPKKGDIPVTSQISGSDLDGDNFFICWDPELIPQSEQPIYVIDAPVTSSGGQKTKKDSKPTGEMYEQMLNFFIQYLNYQKLGQIDNSHLVHADRSPFFAKVKQCIQLAVAHGKAVDFPKSGFCPEVDPKLLVSIYPDFMQKEENPEYVSESILGRLYRDIKERITNLLASCQTQKTGKIDEEIIRELAEGENISFDQAEIRQTIDILLAYERELAGLITLVGVDTEYEIYSGNFSIAKDKVRAFGKNRLIASILSLRSRYFDEFFSSSSECQMDKQLYLDAKQLDLQKNQLFATATRRRALLFYLASYLIKYHKDGDFLNDNHFRNIREDILGEYLGKTYAKEGKFCGFVWFVIPKIMINQKYRIRKLAMAKPVQEEGEEKEANNSYPEDQEEEVI